jgi:hypothetical protein
VAGLLNLNRMQRHAMLLWEGWMSVLQWRGRRGSKLSLQQLSERLVQRCHGFLLDIIQKLHLLHLWLPQLGSLCCWWQFSCRDCRRQLSSSSFLRNGCCMGGGGGGGGRCCCCCPKGALLLEGI